MKLIPHTSAYGAAFEHWIIIEFIKRSSYARLDWSFSYICTKDNVEIDLIIDRPGEQRVLIEIKSKTRVTKEDAKSLEGLGNDIDQEALKLLLSNDRLQQTFGSTKAMHWQEGINLLLPS